MTSARPVTNPFHARHLNTAAAYLGCRPRHSHSTCIGCIPLNPASSRETMRRSLTELKRGEVLGHQRKGHLSWLVHYRKKGEVMTTLRPNTDHLTWKSVLWADGSRGPVFLIPGDGWFDDQGYLRFFSLSGAGSTFFNFKLLPRDQTADTVIRLAQKFLLPLGLTLVGNAVFSGDTVIRNVAQELFEQVGQVVISDYFDQLRISNSVYYNIANGLPLIAEPLRCSP